MANFSELNGTPVMAYTYCAGGTAYSHYGLCEPWVNYAYNSSREGLEGRSSNSAGLPGSLELCSKESYGLRDGAAASYGDAKMMEDLYGQGVGERVLLIPLIAERIIEVTMVPSEAQVAAPVQHTEQDTTRQEKYRVSKMFLNLIFGNGTRSNTGTAAPVRPLVPARPIIQKQIVRRQLGYEECLGLKTPESDQPAFAVAYHALTRNIVNSAVAEVAKKSCLDAFGRDGAPATALRILPEETALALFGSLMDDPSLVRPYVRDIHREIGIGTDPSSRVRVLYPLPDFEMWKGIGLGTQVAFDDYTEEPMRRTILPQAV